ncbi:MAG: serine/threonine-protein kinase [Gemmataceae bacterium]|nr:serine/threonine-protein kinase [Gemmataceae bacterium]MCI0741247.1 serine/threonine-protein kinase [Gemmataceae bacterium]
MTTNSNGTDDVLIDKLVAMDQALEQGKSISSGDTVQPEIQGALHCLKMLDQLWPAGATRHSHRSSSLNDATDWSDQLAADDATDPSLPADHAGTATTGIGRFQVQRKLGEGGCGIVLLAYDPTLRRQLALKIPRPEAVFSPALRQRFLREAQAAAALDHPNIVPVYEAAECGAVCYIASAYCPGTNLRAWLKKQHTPVAARTAALFVATLAEAIHYTHQHGVLHRDLKPSNVLLTPAIVGQDSVPVPPSGQERNPILRMGAVLSAEDLPLEGLTPRIGDFGLAKVLEERGQGEALTQTGAVFGTPQYMAPEQAQGRLHDIGPHTDIYALGVILYEMLAGRVPFQANSEYDTFHQIVSTEARSPRALRANVHPDLETICLKCLQKSPKERFASALELAQELRRFHEGEPILTRPVSRLEHCRRWCRRHPARAALVAMSGAAAVFLCGLLWFQARADRAERDRQLSDKLAKASKIAEGEAIRAGAAAQENARTQEYFALVNSASERIGQKRLGWTWQALEEIAKAGQLEAPSRNFVALRSAAAACSAGIDLREARSLALPFLPHSLAYSPDRKTLAVGQSRSFFFGCQVLLLDAATAKTKAEFTFSPKPVWGKSTQVPDGVRSLAFHPNGKYIAAGTRSGWVHVWEVSKPGDGPISWLAADKSTVESLAWLREGQSLVTLCRPANKLQRWDVSWDGIGTRPTSAKEITARSFEHAPYDLRFNAAGTLLVCTGDQGILFLDPLTLRDTKKPWPRRPYQICFSGDDRFVATEKDGRLGLFDAATGELVRTFPEAERLPAHEGKVHLMELSSDASLLLSASEAEEDRTVKIWESSSGRLLSSLIVGSGGPIPIAWHPEGKTLVAAQESRLVFYEMGGNFELTSLAPHAGAIRACRFAPDGNTVAVAGWPGQRANGRKAFLYLWEALSGGVKEKTECELAARERPVTLAFEPRGTLLAASGLKDGLHFHSLGGRAPSWKCAVDDVRHVQFAPDGQELWAISKLDYLVAWDVQTGKQTKFWSNAFSLILSGNSEMYSLSAGEKFVLAGGRDGIPRLLNAKNGKFLNALTGLGGAPLRAVALTPHERVAIVSSQKGNVRFVRLPGGELLGKGLEHQESVSALVQKGDGSLLASAGRDGKVHLYRRNQESFEHLLSLTAPGPIEDASMNAAGTKLVLAVQHETSLRLWHLDRLFERLRQLGLHE